MKSLNKKLIILFLIISIIVSVIVGGIIYLQYSKYISNSIRTTLENAADFIIETLPYTTHSEYENAVNNNDTVATEYRSFMGRYAETNNLAFIYAVYQDGNTIPTIEISNYIPEEPIIVWDSPAPEALSSLEDNQIYISEPYTDEFGTFISIYKPFPVTDSKAMVIGVDYDISLVQNLRKKAVLSLLLSIISGLFLAFITSFLFAKRITTPLQRLDKELDKLAKSDADLTVHINSKAKDEIGRVAKSFNGFIEKLKFLMIDVKKAIQETDLINQKVTDSTEETSSAIEEISANLDSINTQIEILDSNIDETVSAIEQVTQNITSVDGQIINQSTMVEQSTAAITQMIASLNNVNTVALAKKETTQALSQVAVEGNSIIAETSSNFKDVVDHIKKIQEMASTINDIAAQTNLLSMNAAIEAAHAGESGKGFAVVAEEIRKLADSAGKSSQSISQRINDITQSVFNTDKNVSSMKLTFEKISNEVNDTVNAFSEIEQSVSELNIGGKQILESTNQINEITALIRNGSSEIKSGTAVMLDNSTKIREVSERVTSGMAESTSGAQEIVKAMLLMVNLASDLREIIILLKKNLNDFKTEE